MSDNTMSASGVQVLEPKPGMSGQASAAGSPSGIYEVQNHSGVEWYRVTIAPGKTQDDADVWTLHAEGYTPFSGTAGLDFDPFRHVKFTSANSGEVVYASLIDNDDDNTIPMLTLTYINTAVKDPATPPTGVWLGTSSGGQRYPRVKA